MQMATGAARSLGEAGRIRLFFSLAAASAIAAALFAGPGWVLRDPDNWWHVRVGLDMLESWTLPTVDTYSHTFAGERWISKDWLGEVVLALAYAVGGWIGVASLTIAVAALTLGLLIWNLSEDIRPTYAAGLVFVLLMPLVSGFSARPFFLTFPILIVWTSQLFRASRQPAPPPLWLLPLLCLWANLHTSFAIGFVVAFLAFLDVVERTRLARIDLMARWIGFGLLCPVAVLVHPFGIDVLLAALPSAEGNEAVPLISEWRAFDARIFWLHQTVLTLALFGLLVSGLKLGWAKALFVVVMFHLFMIHIRLMFLFLLLVPLVIGPEIARQFPALATQAWRDAKRDGFEQSILARYRTILSTIGGAIALLAVSALVFRSELEPTPDHAAKGALAYVRQHGVSGNVLNSFSLGGTLVFHGVKTFIDGRTDQLFLEGFFTRQHEAGQSGGKSTLMDMIEEYQVNWALLTEDDPRIPFFEEMPGWRRVFTDQYSVIYVSE